MLGLWINQQPPKTLVEGMKPAMTKQQIQEKKDQNYRDLTAMIQGFLSLQVETSDLEILYLAQNYKRIVKTVS